MLKLSRRSVVGTLTEHPARWILMKWLDTAIARQFSLE